MAHTAASEDAAMPSTRDPEAEHLLNGSNHINGLADTRTKSDDRRGLWSFYCYSWAVEVS